jgi:hypothetical protein
MATGKRGLVDKVKKVAARAGSRGARALVDTAVAATRTVDSLQSKLERVRSLAPGLKKAKKNESTEATAANPLTRPVVAAPAMARRSTASTARGVVESAKPARKAAVAKAPRAVESASVGSGKKTVATQAVAAKRSTAKQSAAPDAEGFKVKRGQKHRHHR